MSDNKDRAHAEETDALKTFKGQMDTVHYLMDHIASEVEELRNAVKEVKKIYLKRHQEGPLKLSDLDSLRATLERAGEALKAALQKAGPLWQAHPYVFDWMLVMTVTYTEAYLENALLLLVNASPSAMRTKERIWLTAEEASQIDTRSDTKQQLSDIRQTMCKRWAEQFLRDKPSAWIAKLTNMGVNTFGPTLAKEMNKVWTRRHELVHAPPPRFDTHGAKKRLQESRALFEQAVSVAYFFVEATDRYVAKVLQGSGLQPNRSDS
jgi:hypothetical protein